MADKVVIWVHGDCLAPNNPALTAYEGSPALFVWDDALLESWQISLKRIVFMYECLLELPVIIRRGDVAAEVLAFAKEHGAVKVATVTSPSPRFKVIAAEIEKAIEVELWEVEPLVDYDGELDTKRFSRYWAVAKEFAFGRG